MKFPSFSNCILALLLGISAQNMVLFQNFMLDTLVRFVFIFTFSVVAFAGKELFRCRDRRRLKEIDELVEGMK
jgi:hypothetical protein